MKWKDSEDEIRNNAEAIEDYYDEEEYSPWKKSPAAEMVSRLSGRFPLALVLGAVALVVLVLLVFALIPDKPNGGDQTAFASFEARLNELETRVIRMEEDLEKLSGLDVVSQNRKIEQLMGRFDRLEKTTAMRIEHLEDTIKRNATTAKSPAPATPPPAPVVSKPREEAKPAAPEAKYHKVVSGDTLYSLGRRYGVSVAQLRKMNNLSPNDSIQVGQQLKVQ